MYVGGRYLTALSIETTLHRNKGQKLKGAYLSGSHRGRVEFSVVLSGVAMG